jgi:hypothetical protein
MAYPEIPGSDFRQLYPSLPPQAPCGIDPGPSTPFNVAHGPPGMYRVDVYGRPLAQNDGISKSAGGQYNSNPRGQRYTYGLSKQYRQPYGTTSGDSPYVPCLSQFAAGNSRDRRPGFSSEPTAWVFQQSDRSMRPLTRL